jgi:hypothetical protein
LQDAAGYVCTKHDFESANGDDEDEEEEEEEEKKKKEKDEEDEEDEDDDDGAIDCLSRQARKVEQDIAGLKRKTHRTPAAEQARAGCRDLSPFNCPYAAGAEAGKKMQRSLAHRRWHSSA